MENSANRHDDNQNRKQPKHNPTVWLLPAVATSSDKEWKLTLLEENAITLSGDFQECMKNFIGNKYPEFNADSELVLFVRIFVTEDNCLLVDYQGVPERGFLDSVFNKNKRSNDSKTNLERHVIFLTSKWEVNGENENIVIKNESDSKIDPELMKGVTLYRIDLEGSFQNLEGSLDDLMINIKAAIGKDGSYPISALAFSENLNQKLNQNLTLQVVMVPSGKEPVQDENLSTKNETKVDFVMHLVVKGCFTKAEDDEDTWCIQEFSTLLKNQDVNLESTEKSVNLGDSFYGIKELISSPISLKTLNSKTLVEELESQIDLMLKKFKEKGWKLGNVWLFIGSHGNAKGIQLSNMPDDDEEKRYIGLKALTAPLINKLNAYYKVLIIDCCRGKLPKIGSNSDNGNDRKNQETYGLMFLNNTGDVDPWSVRGLDKCVTVFGSTPESVSHRPPSSGKKFLAAEKALINLQKISDAVIDSDIQDLKNNLDKYNSKKKELSVFYSNKSDELARKCTVNVLDILKKLNTDGGNRVINDTIDEALKIAERKSSSLLDAMMLAFKELKQPTMSSEMCEQPTYALKRLKDLKSCQSSLNMGKAGYFMRIEENLTKYKATKEDLHKAQQDDKEKLIAECTRNVLLNLNNLGAEVYTKLSPTIEEQLKSAKLQSSNFFDAMMLALEELGQPDMLSEMLGVIFAQNFFEVLKRYRNGEKEEITGSIKGIEENLNKYKATKEDLHKAQQDDKEKLTAECTTNILLNLKRLRPEVNPIYKGTIEEALRITAFKPSNSLDAMMLALEEPGQSGMLSKRCEVELPKKIVKLLERNQNSPKTAIAGYLKGTEEKLNKCKTENKDSHEAQSTKKDESAAESESLRARTIQVLVDKVPCGVKATDNEEVDSIEQTLRIFLLDAMMLALEELQQPAILSEMLKQLFALKLLEFFKDPRIDLKEIEGHLDCYNEENTKNEEELSTEKDKLACEYEEKVNKSLKSLKDLDCKKVKETIKEALSLKVFKPSYLLEATRLAVKELQQSPTQSEKFVPQFAQRIQRKLDELDSPSRLPRRAEELNSGQQANQSTNRKLRVTQSIPVQYELPMISVPKSPQTLSNSPATEHSRKKTKKNCRDGNGEDDDSIECPNQAQITSNSSEVIVQANPSSNSS